MKIRTKQYDAMSNTSVSVQFSSNEHRLPHQIRNGEIFIQVPAVDGFDHCGLD